MYGGEAGIARVMYADATPKHVLDHVLIDCGNVTEKEEILFIERLRYPKIAAFSSTWIALVPPSGC